MIKSSVFKFLSFLTKEELDYLSKNIKKIELKKNTILFYQEDVCNDILLLQEGEVSLYIHSNNNNEAISLYQISSGEQCIVNTTSAITQTPVIANATTNTDIVAYLMPYTIAKKLMQKNEKYQDFIFSLFSIKFNSLTALIEDIKFKKLDARILALLISKNTNLIEITHDGIAQQLSTSRVVISRVLKELEQKSKIILHRGKIELI